MAKGIFVFSVTSGTLCVYTLILAGVVHLLSEVDGGIWNKLVINLCGRIITCL